MLGGGYSKAFVFLLVLDDFTTAPDEGFLGVVVYSWFCSLWEDGPYSDPCVWLYSFCLLLLLILVAELFLGFAAIKFIIDKKIIELALIV